MIIIRRVKCKYQKYLFVQSGSFYHHYQRDVTACNIIYIQSKICCSSHKPLINVTSGLLFSAAHVDQINSAESSIKSNEGNTVTTFH